MNLEQKVMAALKTAMLAKDEKCFAIAKGH